MGVWQGVAMDSLKFHLGLPCSTLLCPAGSLLAAIFYPFEHPTPYAYAISLILKVRFFSQPNERLSLDLVPGGRGQEMPLHYLGEKWDDRVLMNKQKYGYLEAELDQMSEIEEKIRNRRT
jgi:hypothetical protein